MDNKKKYILLVVIMMIVVILVGTYAWLTYRSNDTAMVLTIGDINSAHVTLSPYQIKGTIAPVTAYTSGKVTNVEAVNTNTSNTKEIVLYYQINSIDSSLATTSFKWKITRSTNNGTSYSDYKNGSFNGQSSPSSLIILENETLPVNTTYLYKVYLWLDGTVANNVTGSFDGELRAIVDENAVLPATLPTFITQNAVMDNVASTYVTNSSGIQFNAISSDTNGKGVYIYSPTAGDINPIYYYRGAVTNNNVYFAGFCWKIVRTTETGGIKLIYNGTPVSGACSNTTGTGTQISTSKFNAGYGSPADVGYMYGTRYDVIVKNYANDYNPAVYMFGNDYTYNDGTFTLIDTVSFSYATLTNELYDHHYTCFNQTGICNTLYYVYLSISDRFRAVVLTQNKSADTALKEMLTNSDNSNSSTIKIVIDTWYENNLISYESYLEDTIWCNDREIYQLNGWDPNGGSTSESITFASKQRVYATHIPSVVCQNKNDSFTKNETSRGNGALNHPIGLLTADEVMMAGGHYQMTNSNFYLYTNQSYWLLSPISSYSTSDINGLMGLSSSGTFGIDVINSNGVRPSVSLKPGTTFGYGNGTAANPYRFVSTVS